jgi:hypothetical protein
MNERWCDCAICRQLGSSGCSPAYGYLQLPSRRWHSALFATRLRAMRQSDGGRHGLYLGTGYIGICGRVPMGCSSISKPCPSLREDGKPVFERTDNGGVHAPSLAQAWRSHPAQRLSDERGRNPARASQVKSPPPACTLPQFVDGLRAGQELGALLGYQLERSLHENTPVSSSTSSSFACANAYLRLRRLTDVPDGAPAEVIEARNVIDGYDLVRHIRGRPIRSYRRSADQQINPAEAAVIAAIKGFPSSAGYARCVSDVMMAESAFTGSCRTTPIGRAACFSRGPGVTCLRCRCH